MNDPIVVTVNVSQRRSKPVLLRALVKVMTTSQRVIAQRLR
jgi:hypothetical protein